MVETDERTLTAAEIAACAETLRRRLPFLDAAERLRVAIRLLEGARS